MNDNHNVQINQPGAHVRYYASRFGWDLARWNIFVEGYTDSQYFESASQLYFESAGLRLLGPNLKVIPVGMGEAGGTDGIKENLIPILKLIELDSIEYGKSSFRVVVLLDNDKEGVRTCHYLKDRFIKLIENRDVFVLKRSFPRSSQEPAILTEHIKSANAAWHSLDCEIEDLLHVEVLDIFMRENPECIRCKPKIVNDGHHFEFTAQGKSRLCHWVRSVAVLKDFHNVVEVLKSLRYYLGLNPDGDKS